MHAKSMNTIIALK